MDQLLPSLLSDTTRRLNERLIICPHTYNEASYLFDNAQGSGKGWIDLAYERYNLPILFCEIGCSRMTRDDYLQVIQEQLERSINYNNPAKLIGVCHFQYCDKVWMPNTTEGSFGIVSNTDNVNDVVHYGMKDFTHWDAGNVKNYLNIQVLENNSSFKVLQQAYKK